MGPGPSTAYSPRCLARDFSPWLATRTLTTNMTEWTMASDSFSVFDLRLQGVGIEVDGMTNHAGGHLSVGGDIGDVCAKLAPSTNVSIRAKQTAANPGLPRWETCTRPPATRSSISTMPPWIFSGTGGSGMVRASIF